MSRNYYQIRDVTPHLKNPQKYKGSYPITCRSSWEIKFIIKFLDVKSDIVEWSSESLIVPYQCPVRGGSIHRYFPDFWFKSITKDGTIVERIIEIKPHMEYLMVESPSPPKRMTKSAIIQIQTAMKNKAKWDATRNYCESERKKGRRIYFDIITEKDFDFK